MAPIIIRLFAFVSDSLFKSGNHGKFGMPSDIFHSLGRQQTLLQNQQQVIPVRGKGRSGASRRSDCPPGLL